MTPKTKATMRIMVGTFAWNRPGPDLKKALAATMNIVLTDSSSSYA